MDSKDPNAIFDAVQCQGFAEANERGLTYEIGGHTGMACKPAILATLMMRPRWRVRMPGSTALA
jgi:hypothetical protein